MPMTTQDFFYYLLSFGVLILLLVVSVAAFQFILLLRSLRLVADDIKDTTSDLSMVRNGLRAGVLSLLLRLLGGRGKGGG